MLSMICPVGQEAELSGFFVFSSNILVWLPPLIFTAMNESGISMRWGLVSLVIFFALGIASLSLMDKWENIRPERNNSKDSVDIDIVSAASE
jgi:MFS-type transporter involved in bile tolerance (Atg22 family)